MMAENIFSQFEYMVLGDDKMIRNHNTGGATQVVEQLDLNLFTFLGRGAIHEF